MSNYQERIANLAEIICNGMQKGKNYILIGDNSSGKSDILRSVIEREMGQAVYLIDSVNRTFNSAKVELESRAYEHVNLKPDCVVMERIAPNVFNLQDTFKAMSCIEQLYSKYQQRISMLCKRFLNVDIRIEREKLEAGLTENQVVINKKTVQLSSGYQAVLRIFCEIFYFCDILKAQGWKHGLTVIDELDEYLSPKYSSQIFNFLQKEFPDLNFLVTTHSFDLVECAEKADLIILREKNYDIFNCEELKGAVSAEDIFAQLFFADRLVHHSGNDEVDNQLRMLLNLKMSGGWNEKAELELQEIKEITMLPHQQMLCKQIEEW